MSGQTPAQPRAQQSYRVPRSRIDDFYERAEPLPFVQVGAGEVTGVGSGNETCSVQFESGVEVGGIVILGVVPDVGDWVEVHQRGDLLVVPPDEGGGIVYVQPNEPLGATVGTLWFDTDETL